MKTRVTFDFETRSEVELKKVGAYKYSLHPTTKPTCLSFKVHGFSKMYFLDFVLVNTSWSELPKELKMLWLRLIKEGYEFSAHNAFFERCIYTNILVARYGWPEIPFRRYRCTAAKAAACALPRALDNAGFAMNLKIQKDRRGYSAMMATCKPTKQYNAWLKLQSKPFEKMTEKTLRKAIAPSPPKFLEPDTAPEVFKVLYDYCKIDVRAEENLDDSIPDLIPSELEIWHLNQTLNWRGLRLDEKVIGKAVTILEEQSTKLKKELDKLTMGLITKPGAIKSIIEFAELEGVKLPNLKAQTIEDVLKNDNLDDNVKRLLEIRKALSKASTKKYQAFLNRLNEDGRVRDILMYHGASTGRDTGTGIQPHNFPRGLLKTDKSTPYAAVEDILEFDKESLQVLYGQNLSILFSHVLRNVIIPSQGKELFVADFSKIEVAVLWWLAGNTPGLKVLEAGLDPYKYMAAANTDTPYDEIPDEGDDRQLGKAQVLGCGFGMGWRKFQTTAWDFYRLKLSNLQSFNAVKSYRETNPMVPLLWKDYEKAAVAVVKNGKEGVFTVTGKCKFFLKQGFLWVQLPSGRRLAYKNPFITKRVSEYEIFDFEEMPDGTVKETIIKKVTKPIDTLEFFADNSKTKKWGIERTRGPILTENIVQAVARDLMMPAMVRLEQKNYSALLMVHDEGICEKTIGHGNVKDFVKILTQRPTWAGGLPLEAKGWVGPRYRK